MTFEKFTNEVMTLKKFFEIYCHDKHHLASSRNYTIAYHNQTIQIECTLCNECAELFEIAISNLQNCPHDEKPRCRKCPNPCYDKDTWKKIAKIMKYAGIKTGLSKLTSFFSKDT
ncbi:MAG: nitrous oxide-stimulated promoter family protein [Epsilonproteobacteria bacterium]|nr:nitrous oxide-stimulated promoter family protein [Campylobacterota bacterium]